MLQAQCPAARALAEHTHAPHNTTDCYYMITWSKPNVLFVVYTRLLKPYLHHRARLVRRGARPRRSERRRWRRYDAPNARPPREVL